MKNFDNWLKDRMEFSDKDKLDCQTMAYVIVELSIMISKNGLLSIEKDIPKMKDFFLQKALTLALDSILPLKIIETLQNEIIEKDYKGADLLRRILVMHGVVAILDGFNPMQIAVYLASFFGKNYFKMPENGSSMFLYKNQNSN